MWTGRSRCRGRLVKGEKSFHERQTMEGKKRRRKAFREWNTVETDTRDTSSFCFIRDRRVPTSARPGVEVREFLVTDS